MAEPLWKLRLSLDSALDRGLGSYQRDSAPLPALTTAPLLPLSRKFMPFGVQKRFLEGKRKEREKGNENDFNFFFGVGMKLILKVSKF